MNVEKPQIRQPEIADFDLLSLIGTGSYGDVWLARSVTGAYRAIKFVYRDRFDSDNSFEREFRGIQAFEPLSRSHPNLVQLLHVGRNPSSGFYFYVMELADDVGGAPITVPTAYSPRTLRSVLSKDKLELSQSVSIMQQLATGLAYLHKQSLVHRDIKPANIVFVAGLPKLGDIGLVSHLRKDMSFVGTDGYIPPEGMGQPSADVFSLGKILYELATGKDRMNFPELSSTPLKAREGEAFGRLNAVILKACDPNPRKRFISADALVHALQSLSIDAAGGSKDKIATRIWTFLAIVVVIACALMVVFWSMKRTEPHDAALTRKVANLPNATAQHVTPISSADDDTPLKVKNSTLPSRGDGIQASQPANTVSNDASGSLIPTKTVTTESAGEFLEQ